MQTKYKGRDVEAEIVNNAVILKRVTINNITVSTGEFCRLQHDVNLLAILTNGEKNDKRISNDGRGF